MLDYQPSAQSGVVVPVTDLISNPITLAFWQPNLYSINVTGYDPFENYGEGQIDIECDAPIVALTGFVGTVRSGPGLAGSWFLQLGSQDGRPLGPNNVGVEINADVDNATETGTVGFIQLVTPSRYGIVSGQPVAYSLNGTTVLDAKPNQFIYQDHTEPVTPGTTTPIQIDDGPAVSVNPPPNWSAISISRNSPSETFQTFLMYRPSGGIYVPLSVITWGWQGQTAKDSNDNWTTQVQDGNQFVYDAQDPQGFPLWQATIRDGTWVPG